MTAPDQIDFKTISSISAEQAHKFQVIPVQMEDGKLICFGPEGGGANAKGLAFILGKTIEILALPEEEFRRNLARYYPRAMANPERSRAVLREDSDVVRFVRKFLEEAVAMGASDIHLERYESFARIRFRWEGQLVEKYEVPLSQYNAVVSRIKILSELDISERRLPQDGRIHLATHGQKIDIRVSTVPGKYGEKVVMRLLSRSEKFLQLDTLGMQPEELERLKLALNNSNGIILITGPTGSGKTTTLYASLSRLNQPKVNISTIEDPIEYNIEGINQVQVKEDIGMTFGNALRAFLRQDPDIIMVGEIRDKETAEIAIRAALTGHLVFSTLHTNSSWDAVTRLVDMGVEPYLIAAALRLVAAQRLLRILCPECKKPSDALEYPKIQEDWGLHTHFLPEGCPVCHYTGYKRRKAVYEVIPLTRILNEKIKKVDLDISSYLAEKQIKTLREHVIGMVKTGETSLEEGIMYLMND